MRALGSFSSPTPLPIGRVGLVRAFLARRSRRSFPAVLREGNFKIKVDPKKLRKVVTVTLRKLYSRTILWDLLLF